MRVLIVYAHPSSDSFTRHVLLSFTEGLLNAGHGYELSDLYAMGFQTDMSEEEYLREAYYREKEPVPEDVRIEQEKLGRCDAVAFIYPLFWTDCPAKLKGWFDRVWTYGFAYGDNRSMKTLKKGLVLCVTGHSLEDLTAFGHLDAMKNVMLRDRMHDRVMKKDMIILDDMSRYDLETRNKNWKKHLKTAYDAGFKL